MPDRLTDRRLLLFAFTQAENRHVYLAILKAFDSAREQTLLQLGATGVVARVDGLESVDDALQKLDQLVSWGVLDRIQDDQRVRTIAEYRQRRSVYLMTELGWLATRAVHDVMAAQPGEAELRRLVLPKVLDELKRLADAVAQQDAERVGLHLDEVHRMLTDLADHAQRFLIATSQLALSWEADPQAFISHKKRLLGHLDGFLITLAEHRPLLSAAVHALLPQRARLLDLAAAASGAAFGPERARERAEQHLAGVVAWFEDTPGRPSQAASLDERTTRAIHDLTTLLRRVFDATAGGVSRASRLEELAGWFMACPDDATAHALAGATSGVSRARHFGTFTVDEDVEPSTSWWDAPPAPVDTTLRKRGRTSAPGPPQPIADRAAASRHLRRRQQARQDVDRAASGALVNSLLHLKPLAAAELQVLLRLLSRALHARTATSTTAHTVRGRLRMTLTHADRDTWVPTVRGVLCLKGLDLTVESSAQAQVSA